MALNKKVEAEIAIAATVIAAIVVGAIGYYYGKSSSNCLYPSSRSAVLLNMFGKVVVVPPNKKVEGDWGEAYYKPQCDKAKIEIKFKSGMKIYIKGKPNGNLIVTTEYQGQKCSKEIKAVPVLPYVAVTATMNRVLVSAYGQVLVINIVPQLSCRVAR